MDGKFLEGKGALITEGASGLGRGVAQAFNSTFNKRHIAKKEGKKI